MDELVINRRLTIPSQSLRFVASTASGPGGQHVNRVKTRVTLIFDLEGCPALGVRRRDILRQRLAGRIEADGTIRVICGRHRAQSRNLQEARQRLASLLQASLISRPVRRPTRPTAASRARLKESKSRDKARKQARNWRYDGQ